jgi:hypothetical protein
MSSKFNNLSFKLRNKCLVLTLEGTPIITITQGASHFSSASVVRSLLQRKKITKKKMMQNKIELVPNRAPTDLGRSNFETCSRSDKETVTSGTVS